MGLYHTIRPKIRPADSSSYFSQLIPYNGTIALVIMLWDCNRHSKKQTMVVCTNSGHVQLCEHGQAMTHIRCSYDQICQGGVYYKFPTEHKVKQYIKNFNNKYLQLVSNYTVIVKLLELIFMYVY